MLRGLLIEGRAEPWRELGFDVVADRFAVGGVTFALTGRAGGAILGWDLGIGSAPDVEGLRHERIATTTDALHPNGAVALDHLVVATSDLERTSAGLATVGLTPRRTVEALPGRNGQRFRFLLLGTAVLEVIAPSVPHADGAARFTGLAFATSRLDELPGELGARLGPVHDAVQPGRRIASVREDVAGIGIPVAFMTPRS